LKGRLAISLLAFFSHYYLQKHDKNQCWCIGASGKSIFVPNTFDLLNKKFMERNDLPLTENSDLEFDRNFKPKGAIAFFILLVILGAVIWYGIYFLMLSRA
jgi:hypothetical protein